MILHYLTLLSVLFRNTKKQKTIVQPQLKQQSTKIKRETFAATVKEAKKKKKTEKRIKLQH